MYNKDIILDKFVERESLENLFKIMFQIYKEALDISIGRKAEFSFGNFDFLKGEKTSILIKKIQILSEYLNAFSYNLNIALMLDRFVIEMGEVNE